MEDYKTLETVEGWALALGDNVVFTDYDGDVHHIEVFDLDDENSDFIGDGYCHDCDDKCTFRFGAFEEVELWTWTL